MPNSLLQKLRLSRSRSVSPRPPAEAINTDGPNQTTQEKLGLFVLAEPQGPKEAITVDIVAVHGLNGDPYRTWEKDGKLWLGDPAFLPSQIPSARILSYGFNSTVALSQSFAGTEDFALSLLNFLEQERSDAQAENRPIIFVCHSLGGLVVKKVMPNRMMSALCADYFDIRP